MEGLAVAYFIGMLGCFVICWLITEDDFSVSEATGFSMMWPLVVVAYLIIGTMGTLVWVCKRYWVRRFACCLLGHCWHELKCCRCGNTEPLKVLNQAVNETYKKVFGGTDDDDSCS